MVPHRARGSGAARRRLLPLLPLLLVLSCTAGEQPAAPAGAPTPTPTRPSPSSTPTTPEAGPVEGADISWPQCPTGMGIPRRPGEGQPMPEPSARFVVVGLTNGPAWHRNPCIESQLAELRQRALPLAAYAVASYPSDKRLRRYGAKGPYDPETTVGRLANAGFAQAKFNLRTMQDVGLDSPVVWVDVEPYPLLPWSSNLRHNIAVVDGILQAYVEAGVEVGFYSAPGLWAQVLGDKTYGLPEWRTAGTLRRKDALERCGAEHSFQGGEAVLAQWYTATHDFDVLCPGVTLGDWFRG